MGFADRHGALNDAEWPSLLRPMHVRNRRGCPSLRQRALVKNFDCLLFLKKADPKGQARNRDHSKQLPPPWLMSGMSDLLAGQYNDPMRVIAFNKARDGRATYPGKSQRMSAVSPIWRAVNCLDLLPSL